MLIDDVCTEDIFNYGTSLMIGGMILGAAGILMISSVLIAPNLANDFGRGEGLKI